MFTYGRFSDPGDRPMICRRLLIVGLTVALSAGQAQAQESRTPASDPWSSDPAVTTRAGSDSAINTSIAISQVRFVADTALHVVLSRDDKFPDALAGTPLLGDGPLLLADQDVSYRIGQPYTPELKAEIDRVLPDGGRVYILGGTGALGQNLEDQLRADGYDVKRLAGTNRYVTAQRIAEEVAVLYPESAARVLVARGFGTESNPTAAWADSVTGGAFAANARHPIVLSDTASLSPEAAAFLRGRDSAVLLGGPGALSEQVAADAGALVSRVDRAAGSNRAATAVKVMNNLWRQPSGQGRVTIINGFEEFGWAFGLPAAGLAADFDAPMLPVSTATLPADTSAALTACDTKQIQTLVIGASAIINDSVLMQVEARDGDPCVANVDITRVVADAPGRDDEPNAGEYVELTNRESAAVAVGGWVLADDDGNSSRICDGMTIPAGGTVRVYSNTGTNTPSSCFMQGGTYLNNDGDTVILRDDRGNEVDRITYAGGGTG